MFKLDTGADVTVISHELCKSLGTSLRKSHLKHSMELEVMGEFEEILSYNGRYTSQRIFVIKGLRTNLLGLQAITALSLAARFDSGTD